ncbi:MAG: hypothetical protein KDD53_08935, partial [Bdellovibrionales bacterium]|nr:hypothetical protein [Bdellovibrionales bacterium]
NAADAMLALLLHNMHREDVRPCDEARAMLELMRRKSLSTQLELASLLSMSKESVSRRLRLLRLPRVLQDWIDEGKLPEYAGIELVKAMDNPAILAGRSQEELPDILVEIAQAIMGRELGVSDLISALKATKPTASTSGSNPTGRGRPPTKGPRGASPDREGPRSRDTRAASSDETLVRIQVPDGDRIITIVVTCRNKKLNGASIADALQKAARQVRKS